MRASRIGLVAGLIAAGLTAAAPGGVSSATTGSKPFAFTVAASGNSLASTGASGASQVGEGTTVTFTLTITDETSTQQIGSVDVNLVDPNGTSGFVLAVPPVPAQPDVSTSGETILLRNLALQPGTSFTATLTGYAPCSSETSDSWSIVAKQSNNFSGPPGNTMAPLTSPVQTLATSGTCSLQYRAQPADSAANAAIGSVAFDSSGNSPVQVGIYDASGALITAAAAPASSAPVSISLGTNPTGATLSGTTTENARGGVASFANLSVNRPTFSSGYQLAASSPDAPPPSVLSNPFLIWQAEATCAGNSAKCSVTATANQGNTQITGVSAGGGSIEASLNVQSFSCGDTSTHAPFSTTLASSGISGTKTIAVTIAKAFVAAPPSQYAVCYESPTAFVDASGTLTNLGILPTCSATSPVAPCVQSIARDKSRDIVETLLVSAADPWVH